MILQKLDDGGGGFFDRPAGHVEHRPVVLAAEASRLATSRAPSLRIDVVGFLVLAIICRRFLRIWTSWLASLVRPTTSGPRTVKSSGGRGQPGTIGTFAALMPRLAR